MANELFKCHVLGENMDRPFPKPKSPFGDLFAAVSGGGEESEDANKKKPKAKPIDPPSGTKSKLKKRK